MFKRLSIVRVVGAVRGVTAGGVTMGLPPPITAPETIVVINPKERFVDVGKRGDSPGDSFLFVDSLTDEDDGSRVGTVRGHCPQ